MILFILNGLHLQQKLSHSQTISLGVLSSLIKDSVCSGVQQGLDLDNLNNLCKVRKANNKKKLTSISPNNVANEEVSDFTLKII